MGISDFNMRETERVLLGYYPRHKGQNGLKVSFFSLHDRRRILSSSLCGKRQFY